MKRILRQPSTSEVVTGAGHLVRSPEIPPRKDNSGAPLMLTIPSGEQIPMTHPETLASMLIDRLAGISLVDTKGKL